MIYEVGESYPAFIGLGDSIVFDLDDSGAAIVAFFQSKDKLEICPKIEKEQIDIYFIEIDKVMWFLVGFGGSEWIPAPYHPAMSKGLSGISFLDSFTQLPLRILIVDSNTGTVLSVLSAAFDRPTTETITRTAQEISTFPLFRLAIQKTRKCFEKNNLLKNEPYHCTII